MAIRKSVGTGVAIMALGVLVPGATATAAPSPAAHVAEAGTGSADPMSGSGTLLLLIEELFSPCPFSSTVCPTD